MDQLLFVAIRLVYLAIVATPLVIAILKRRLWLGIGGLAAVMGANVRSLLLAPETEGDALDWLLPLVSLGGLVLMVLGAALPARERSWWDRNRVTPKGPTPVPQSEPTVTDRPSAAQQPVNRKAIWAFACFAAGLFLVVPLLATLPLGILSLREIRSGEGNQGGRGLALAAVIGTLVLIPLMVFFAWMGDAF